MKKRLGKFNVSDAIIDKPEFIEILKHLEFVPYHVTQSLKFPGFEYMGTAKAFDLIEVGSIIPEYDIVVFNENDKITEVKAKLIC